MTALAAGLLLVAGLTDAEALAGSAPRGASPDTVVASVEVRMSHRLVGPDGAPLWALSGQTAFTLQKLRTASGDAKVVLAYHPTPTERRGPVRANPLEGARVEYDPTRRSTTVIDGAGRANPRLSPDHPSPPALGTFDEWLAGLVLRASEVPARRDALARSHGRPVGTVGRLTRYLRTDGNVTEEVLADAGWGVPVEMNVLQDGALQGRTTIEYEPTADGRLQRRRLRSEQVIDARSGRRAVLSIEFSNIRVQGR